MSSHHLSPSYKIFANQLSSVFVPNNLQDTLDNPKWKVAMVEEMKALQKNDTWELVELPKVKKTIGCKWLFTMKHKVDGSVERFKARLVAKGYTQTYEVDYQEIFSSMARVNTIQVLLSLVVNIDKPLQQFDVKNAFLHEDLEVYMDFPLGFANLIKRGKVCRLRKSLYRAWFCRFTQAMKEYGYQGRSDYTLFLNHAFEGNIIALIMYVDDIVVTGNDSEENCKVKTYLASKYEIKDLGILRYFLDIEVARSKLGIFDSIFDLLDETGMLACKPVDTPIELNHKLGESLQDTLVDKE